MVHVSRFFGIKKVKKFFWSPRVTKGHCKPRPPNVWKTRQKVTQAIDTLACIFPRVSRVKHDRSQLPLSYDIFSRFACNAILVGLPMSCSRTTCCPGGKYLHYLDGWQGSEGATTRWRRVVYKSASSSSGRGIWAAASISFW